MTVLKEARTPLSAREIAIEVMLGRGQPDAPNCEIVQIMAGINYGLQKRIGREVMVRFHPGTAQPGEIAFGLVGANAGILERYPVIDGLRIPSCMARVPAPTLIGVDGGQGGNE